MKEVLIPGSMAGAGAAISILAQQPAAAAAGDGQVLLNVAFLFGMIFVVVGALATAVGMLYRAQSAGFERVITETKAGYEKQLSILATRVEVLTGRETTLLTMVGEKDKYVLEVLNGVVTTTREQTVRHDATMRDMMDTLKGALGQSQAYTEKVTEEHRMILEAIKDNGGKMEKAVATLELVSARLDTHEKDLKLHRIQHRAEAQE